MTRAVPKPPIGPFKDFQGDVSWKIPLTQGLFALVSDTDVARVSQYKWCASNESRGTKYYAIRRVTIDGQSTKIRMHRFIMDQPPKSLDGRVVDHLNNDGLDNRRGNLEVITQEENMKRSPTWKKKVEEPQL